MSVAQLYSIKQMTPLTREEFFALRKIMSTRGVLPHELVLARAINTVEALYTELAQAGILEGPSPDEVGNKQPGQT